MPQIFERKTTEERKKFEITPWIFPRQLKAPIMVKFTWVSKYGSSAPRGSWNVCCPAFQLPIFSKLQANGAVVKFPIEQLVQSDVPFVHCTVVVFMRTPSGDLKEEMWTTEKKKKNSGGDLVCLEQSNKERTKRLRQGREQDSSGVLFHKDETLGFLVLFFSQV